MEGFQEGRIARNDDIIIDYLKNKVVDDCGVAQYSTKNVTKDTLSTEKNGIIACIAPHRVVMKLFLHRVGRKEGVSTIPENSTRS